jgi:hypothetical protein
MFENRRKRILFSNNNKPKYIYSFWALKWKEDIISLGHTIDDSNLQAIDTHIFKPALANGNIYNRLDRFNIYAGLVGHQGAARTCTIRKVDITRVNSPIFDINGYKTSGTGYLLLNFNPTAAGLKLSRNSLNHGYIVKTPDYPATIVRAMGCRDFGTSSRISLLRDNTPQSLAYNNDGTGAGNTNTVGSGWVAFTGVRTNGTTENYSFINNNGVLVTVSSVAVPNSNSAELTEYTNLGTATGAYDTFSHGASWHGSKELESERLITYIRNYFNAIGI